MKTIPVTWIRCSGSRYCDLRRVIFPRDPFGNGVYVIWRGDTGKVVYVGQGDISVRVLERKADESILKYGSDLRVTWATVVSLSDRLGIERYLIDLWDPPENHIRPKEAPVKVNLPD